jgi:formylglycine-generating enzyme required for sulfatase activity
VNDTPREDPPQAAVPTEPAASAVVAGRGAVALTSGSQLGDYALLELLVDDPATQTWRAMQDSVEREVALECLKPEFAKNPAALDGFRALVQARAGVVHPYITPVYEAQETKGTVYYTRELVRGRNLTQLHAAGTRLTPDQAMSIFLATSEAMSYLDGNQTERIELTPDAVHWGEDGIPRLDNLATAHSTTQPSPVAELPKIGQAMSVLLHRGMPESAAADGFLKWVTHGGISDWGQAAKRAREVLRSITRGGTPAGRHAPSSTIAAKPARSGRKPARPLVLVGTLGICAAIVAGAFFALTGGATAPAAKAFDKMIAIPAGSVSTGDTTESVAAFSIDEHEVTIAQYAEFLHTLNAAGDAAKRFDHSDQPATKSGHTPASWSDLYKAAKHGGKFQGQPISLNHPIIAVDWWDAYAYATWKGHRLPTAAEWHLAALGPDPDARFPWGHTDAPALYNSGADFEQNGTGGTVDGFNYWAPVTVFSNDRSPRGVFGMAGNVSEWVDTWVPHPEFPDKQVPAVMGGSFATKAANITERRPAKAADAAQLAVGFRTATSPSATTDAAAP